MEIGGTIKRPQGLMTCYITLSACMKCVLSTFSSTAAEPARPIKGPDERLSQRAQLSSPIQTLTYAAAVAALGCSCGEGKQMEDGLGR